ncbi:MAG: beta strand repeat-containing protein [Isosphaerales bacterium]
MAVTLITKDTRAYLGQQALVDAGAGASSGFSTTTIHGLAVQAGSSEDLFVATAAGAGGFCGGLAGDVSVEIVKSSTQAYIGDGAQVNTGSSAASSAQTVNVSAVNETSIFAFDGTLAVAVGGALAGSVDVGIIQNNTAAYVGNGARVNARKDVVISAVAAKTVTTHTVSASAGSLAIGGAVWVYAIGAGPDTYAQGEIKEGGSTPLSGYIDGQTGVSSVTGALGGYHGQGSDSNGRVAVAMSGAQAPIQNATPHNAVNTAVDSTPPSGGTTGGTWVPGGTVAFIGDRATVSAGQNVAVNANETITQDMVAGQASIGLLSFGASVGVADVAASTQAYVGQQATVSTGGGGDVGVNANLAENVRGRAYAGAASLALAAEAQVVVLHDSSIQAAYVSDGANVPQARNVQIQAQANRTLDAGSIGGAFSAVSLGASVATATADGSTRAYLGTGARVGADAGKQVHGLSINALSSTNAITEAHAVQAGVVAAGAYNNATAVINPSVKAFIGGGSTVQVGFDIGIAARGAGDATAYARGDTAGIGAAVGVAQAKATMTPTLTAHVGQGAALSAGGNITLEAAHNYDPLGNPLPEDASATATSGGKSILVGGAGATADATNSPNLDTYIDASSTISAGNNVSLIARSNDKVRALALGAGKSVIVGVGISSAHATAASSDKAHVGVGATLTVGHDLTISATSADDVGTPLDPGAKTVASAKGVVAGVFLNDTTAAASPTLQAFIGGSAHVTVGHSTNITAGALGNSIAEADGTDTTPFGVVDVGESQARASWGPTVTAYVDAATTLSSGGDVFVQATNDHRYDDSATATSSIGRHFVGVAGSSATVSVRATIDASIGTSAAITAGNDLVVTAHSLNVTGAQAKESASSGFYTGGSTFAASLFANEARAFTGTGAVLVAGRDLRIDSQSSLLNVVFATGGQSGELNDGTVQADAEVTSNTTESQLGTANTVRAGGQFTLQALNSDWLTAASSDNIHTLFGTNTVQSDARISNSLTHAALGDNAVVRAARVFVTAEDLGIHAEATSTASTDTLYATTLATSVVDARPLARADVGQNADVVGNEQISILAREDNTTTWTWASESSGPGTVDALADNTLVATALVVTAPTSRLRTAALDVEAPTPAGSYTRVATMDTPFVPSQGYLQGSENRYGLIDFNSAVTVLAAPSPSLHVDAAGNIVTAVGVTAHNQGNDLVVDPININPVGSVTFRTGVIVGSYSLDFKKSFDTVTILNESARNLVLNGMQTQSSDGSMNVSLSGTPFPNLSPLQRVFWNFQLNSLDIPAIYAESKQTSIYSTQVNIKNQGTSAITLNTPIHNGAGATTIWNVGGSILAGTFGGTVETTSLVLTAGGSIGTAANRVSARMMQIFGPPPSLTVSGHGDVYLSLQGVVQNGLPLTVDVANLHSDARADLQIATGVQQIRSPQGKIVELPVAGEYHLIQVTANSDITVSAASTTLYLERLASTSGNVSITTTFSGHIFALGGTAEVNITAGALALVAAGDIGQASHYLNTVARTVYARAATGKVFIHNT